MSSKKKPNAPPESVALYKRLIATVPEIELKGASMPYTSVNGHMFSYLDAEGKMALRLPSGEREAFMEKYQLTLMVAYGIVQKEYVAVPSDMLARTDELQPYLQASFAYVSGLKPKPTKKPTASAD